MGLVRLLFLLGVITVGAQSGQPGPARLSDTLVPSSAIDPLTLAMPASASMAAAVAERALATAGVRYGFEGPAADPTRPGIDLARYGESAVTLSGQRLGSALDAIARAVPQIRWTEADGAIVIRANSGETFLDRKIDRFSVSAANSRVLLETLLLALDPGRRGQGVVGLGRPGGGGAMNAPASRAGRDVTVTLTNVTVAEILSTVARLNGALSWAVKYDGTPADYDHASIALAEGGEPVTALSPFVLRTNPLATPATFGAARPTPVSAGAYAISPSLGTMLTLYAARNGVRVGMEELPTPASLATNSLSLLGLSPPIPGLPPIDLNGLSSADALRRLVALDSRYELSESGGRFLVRPKPDVAGRLDVLDRLIDGFTAAKEPATDVMARLAQQIGTHRPSPSRVPTTSPFGTMLATPLDIALTGRVSIRRVLDAISDGTGLVWSMRPTFQPGSSTRIQLGWRGPSGSSSLDVMLAEDLAPAPAAARKPLKLVPVSLDRTIVRFALDPSDPTKHPFEQLARLARAPVGIELLPPPAADRDPRLRTRAQPEVVVGPGSFSEALYVLLEKEAAYDIVSTNGVISIGPTALLRDPAYFMNRRIDRFVATDEPFYRALGRVRQLVNPAYAPTVWNGPGATTMNRPVTVSLERMTIREILNALAATHGGVMWTTRFEPLTPVDRAEPRDSDWVLVVFPVDASSPAVRLEPLGPDGAARSRPSVVPISPSAVRSEVILDLPVTAFRAKYAVQQLTRSASRPAGVETIVDANTPLETTAQFYDLTGLPMAEALAKIASMVPGYVVDDTGGVMHLRPTSLVNDPANWLNQKVDRFEQRFDNLRDALNAAAAIKPSAATSAFQPPGGIRPAAPPSTPPSNLPASVQAELATSITVAMTNVTVREILDEIARQHGSLTWALDHRPATGAMTLSFSIRAWTGNVPVR